MKVDTWSLRREFEHEGPGRYPTRSYPEQHIFYVSIYPEKDYSYKKDFLDEQQNCIFSYKTGEQLIYTRPSLWINIG